MDRNLLFVVGASGTGKTAALRALAERRLPDLACFHFDSIGVPSPEEMLRTYGGGERWQEAATHAWLARLEDEAAPIVILEGQTRPSFIRAKFPARRTVGILLLDCAAPERGRRL